MGQRPSLQLDIGVADGWPHATHIGVGFGVQLAREAIASAATDAGPAIAQVQSHWQREWVIALCLQAINQTLGVGFVRDMWVRVGCVARWLAGVIAGFAVHPIDMLGLFVVGFQLGVTNWPSGGQPFLKLNRFKVAFAEAREGCAIHLGIATHKVIRAWSKGLAGVIIKPNIACLVALLCDDRLGLPVLRLLRQKIATLQEQHLHAAIAQRIGQRPAARAATDNNEVVHCGFPFVLYVKRQTS